MLTLKQTAAMCRTLLPGEAMMVQVERKRVPRPVPVEVRGPSVGAWQLTEMRCPSWDWREAFTAELGPEFEFEEFGERTQVYRKPVVAHDFEIVRQAMLVPVGRGLLVETRPVSISGAPTDPMARMLLTKNFVGAELGPDYTVEEIPKTNTYCLRITHVSRQAEYKALEAEYRLTRNTYHHATP